MAKVLLDKNKIKELRKNRYLSQEALAASLEEKNLQVSLSSIKRAETGKPTLYRIARTLADFFEVDVEEITQPIQSPPNHEKPNKEYVIHLTNNFEKILPVGVLHSLTGILSHLEKGVFNTTMMAIKEINAKGGILGHTIKPVIADGQSTESGFLKEAANLIMQPDLAVIFGCSTSSSRKRVKPLIEDQEHLLIYPFQYEGIESSKDIFYVGPTINQQATPAVNWLTQLGCKRFMLIGSDYVYPIVTNEVIKRKIFDEGGEVVGEHYEPLGCLDFQTILQSIDANQPDAIILTIVGLDANEAFLSAFHNAGFDIKLMSLVISEDDLPMLSAQYTKRLYSVFSYFQNIKSVENNNFVRTYQEQYGESSRIGGYMESAYVGVHLWAKACETIQSFEREKVKEAMKTIMYTAPGGQVKVDENNNHVWRQVHIAQVDAKQEFQLMQSTPAPIAPEPYPKWRTEEQWHQLLKQLRKRWQGNWEKQEEIETN